MIGLLVALLALAPEPAPAPGEYVDTRVLAFVPHGSQADLILAVGVESGIAVGDRGFVACAPNESSCARSGRTARRRA